MSNCELPLTISVSLQRGSEIRGTPNQQAIVRRSHQQAVPRRSHPAQYGEDRFGPPTLERSGSEHRRAVTSFLLRRKAWLEVELSLQERRRGRKNSTVGRLHPLVPEGREAW